MIRMGLGIPSKTFPNFSGRALISYKIAMEKGIAGNDQGLAQGLFSKFIAFRPIAAMVNHDRKVGSKPRSFFFPVADHGLRFDREAYPGFPGGGLQQFPPRVIREDFGGDGSSLPGISSAGRDGRVKWRFSPNDQMSFQKRQREIRSWGGELRWLREMGRRAVPMPRFGGQDEQWERRRVQGQGLGGKNKNRSLTTPCPLHPFRVRISPESSALLQPKRVLCGDPG
jgi:hypothetical protein